MFILYPANVVQEEACWVKVDLAVTISITSTPVLMASVFACTDNGLIIKNTTKLIPKIKHLIDTDIEFISNKALSFERTDLYNLVNVSKFSLAEHKANIENILSSQLLIDSFRNTKPKGI